MSPDPRGLLYANPLNPQSLNLYSYALNNPLRNTDPTGMYCFYGGIGDTPQNDDDPTDYDFGAESADDCADGGQWIDTSATVMVDGNGNGGDSADSSFINPISPSVSNSISPPPTASNKPGITTCAANFADKYSIAGGLHSLGIGNSGVGGFVTNALGGNAFSGATNLISSFGSGAAGGHSVFYNMGESLMAGPLQGIPGGRGPWGASASDLATGAIAGGAFTALTGTGQTLQGLNGAASFASTGIDAAEFATGVGEAKFAYDFLSYGAGLLACSGN